MLGLPFDAVDMAGAVQRVRDAVARRTACFISTPNLNFLIGCRTDSQFRNSVIHSDLSIADGMPLVWIARLLGIPIRERVAGSTLFDTLRYGNGERLSVFFFGGPDGVAEAACRRVNADGQGLVCVGYASPGFGSVEEMSTDEIIQHINASKADLLVVALGARKGQAWIERNRHRLNVPVISHLGAVLNFAAGTVNRAPEWAQNTGLEWLWRIKEEPMLWRRYFADGLALLTLLVIRVLPYAWYLQRHKADPDELVTARVETREERQHYIVGLRGAWTQRNIGPVRECFSRAVLPGKDIRLEMSGVTYVDSAFVGLVMLLQGHQRQHGRLLQLVSLREPVRRVFRYCCAQDLCSSIQRRASQQYASNLSLSLILDVISRKVIAMPSMRVALLIATLMCAASVGAIVARPTTKAADLGPAISLETMVPKQFGDWGEEPQRIVQVINPQTQELLDKLYTEILARTYVNSEGYRIMLSLAYGSDQRGTLQAHKPEVCYPAQGFTLHRSEASEVTTSFGAIPAQRLFTSRGPRVEPVTYWFTVGDKAVEGKLQKRLVDLRYGLTGRIPDGMLFRVSSIDRDQARANRFQDLFINQLLQAVSPAERKRLSGLGES